MSFSKLFAPVRPSVLGGAMLGLSVLGSGMAAADGNLPEVHGDIPIETGQKPQARVNFRLNVVPPARAKFDKNTATDKILEGWVGVGFQTDEPPSGFAEVKDWKARWDDWWGVVDPWWPWHGSDDQDQAASFCHPFMFGAAHYTAQALDDEGHQYYVDPQYQWTAEGQDPKPDPYPYLVPDDGHWEQVDGIFSHTDVFTGAIDIVQDESEHVAGGSRPDKFFHFDFGRLNAETPFGAPKDTTVTVKMSEGPRFGVPRSNKPELGPAKVVIHWKSPWDDATPGDDPTTVVLSPAALITMGDGSVKTVGQLQEGEKIRIPGSLFRRKIQHIDVLPSGLYSINSFIDPDDDLDTEGGQLQQDIERIQEAYKEAIYTGAQGVKYGLEAYKAVAEFYAYGPVYEMGGELLAHMGAKALELTQAAIQARQTAQRLRTVDEATQILIVKVEQQLDVAGQTPEEINELKTTLTQLKDVSGKLEHGAADLERSAAASERLAKETQDAAIAEGEGTPIEPGCFAQGTLISMADGSQKAIERIREGDMVLSRDVHLGTTTPRKVLRTFQHIVDRTLLLSFDDETTVETTEVHPFFTADGRFVNAGDVSIGTSIVTRAGPAIRLSGSRFRSQKTTVYNFTVDVDHDYFVGSSEVLVHNANFSGTCGFEDAPAGSPGTIEHKLDAYQKYLDRKAAANEPVKTERQWSNVYDVNMSNAKRGNAAADAYGATLGWGEKQVVVQTSKGDIRRIDWADKGSLKGIEYKNFTANDVSGAQRASDSRTIAEEADIDKDLMNDGWQIRWVFEGKKPNGPLRAKLANNGILWKMKDDTLWRLGETLVDSPF